MTRLHSLLASPLLLISACGAPLSETTRTSEYKLSASRIPSGQFAAPRKCPEGFVGVPGDPKKPTGNVQVGIRGFCVSKYEMKHPQDVNGRFVIDRSWSGSDAWRPDVTATPESTPSSRPWVLISWQEAYDACQRMSAPEFNFSLISSHEWDIISENIRNTNENWSEARVGAGVLATGFRILDVKNPDHATFIRNTTCAWRGEPRGFCPAPLPISEIWNDHSDLSTSAGSNEIEYFSQRRTHLLSNGQTLWDFGGNVSEWIISAPGTKDQVARGGNFSDVKTGLHSKFVVSDLPTDVSRRLKSTEPRQTHVGFRCVAHPHQPY